MGAQRATVSDCLQMREKYKKDEKVSVYSYSFISSRYRIKIIGNMNKVSNDIRWFCNQLREAEQILSNALDRAEAFSEHDKQIINRIRSDVDMADLTLLQLLSPIAPR